MDRLGGQRVGILLEQKVLDGAGEPVLDEYRQPTFVTSTVWVYNCLFEIQTPGGLATAGDTVTTTDTETGWCLMPVAAGAVPAVTDDGERLSIAPTEISELQYGAGKPFRVQGKAAVEFDDEGREDHVFVLCTRRRG